MEVKNITLTYNDGSVATFEVSINMAALVNRIGRRARSSKVKKATTEGNSIVVKVIEDTRK